jgi:hypothetical protein
MEREDSYIDADDWGEETSPLPKSEKSHSVVSSGGGAGAIEQEEVDKVIKFSSHNIFRMALLYKNLKR